MKVLEIDSYGSVDLGNPQQALDYLIYLTEDYDRMVEKTLNFDIDKTSLSDYIKNFDECDYKFAYSINYPWNFYSAFVKNDSFIFDSYFFNNNSGTDLEKISKINRLKLNLTKLIDEIKDYLKTDNLKDYGNEYFQEQLKKYENENPNFFILNGVKTKLYPYKLLLYYFGVKLNDIYDKVVTNFLGFVKEHSTEKDNSHTDHNNKFSHNHFPDIFKTVAVYKSFLNYSTKYIIEPYRDYSYLFQRLKKDGQIHDMKHKKFIDWLLSEDLINEKDYNHFLNNNGFRSYSKSYSVERENNFNNTFL